MKSELMAKFNSSRLYLVSSQEFSTYSTEYVIHEALKGGIKLFQMREKSLSKADKLTLAKKLKVLAKRFSAIFIINDDPLLAKEVDADGVHLGQEDFPVIEARAILGREKIIGLSTHNYREAIDAQELPIDYINIGPVNSTNTKKHLKVVSEDEISKIVKDIRLPFTFMGGIKEHNMARLLKYKPVALAVLTEITLASNIARKTETLLKKIMEAY